MAQDGAMQVTPRQDVQGAFTVTNGTETYHVYVGTDPAFPRCDCPSELYKPLPQGCKHWRYLHRYLEAE